MYCILSFDSIYSYKQKFTEILSVQPIDLGSSLGVDCSKLVCFLEADQKPHK